MGAPQPKQRDVVLLRHFDGASVADIARRLGLARDTVHEHLERGHAELRRALAPFDDDRRMTRGLALLVAAGDPPRAAVVAASAAAASAAAALVATLSIVAWRAVAPPKTAPTVRGAPEAQALERSASLGPESETPLQLADSGAQRAAIATAKAPSAGSGTATLRVRVVDEDGVGVPRASVDVGFDGEVHDTNTTRTLVDTDPDGRWSDTVPAGKELTVSVHHDEARTELVTIAALADDTTVDTTVRVRTRPDLDLELSVVDAATQEPIGGARVFLAASSGIVMVTGGSEVLVLEPEIASDLVSDADGIARVRLKSWENIDCRVHAEGYAPRVQTLYRRDVSASQTVAPVVVTLARGTRVLGQVTGAPLPAEVRASFPSRAIEAPELARELMGWSLRATHCELRAAVDDAGKFIIPDIPGGTAVALALHDVPAGGLLYKPAAPIVTVAGEDHHVSWDLATTRRIVCTVREVDGLIAEDIQVLLFAHGDARVGATPNGRRKWSQSARTDEAGIAVFDTVALGAWFVGLAPSGKGERAFAAYTVAVDVIDTPGDVHVDLSMHRDLYIEGRVVAPDGGAPALVVGGHNDTFHVTVYGPQIVDGRFRLGPLLPGLYRVSVMTSSSGEAPSYAPLPEVEVAAGTTDLELVLRPGARLVLRAIDAASRAPVNAEFLLLHVGNEPRHFQATGVIPASPYDGLELGTYWALARAADGRVGVLDSIPLRSTEPFEAVVPLAPGGTLVLRAPLDGVPRDVYILRGDTVVKLHQLELSSEERSILPPGRYRVGVKQRPRDQPRSANAPRFDAVFEVDVVVGGEVTLDVAPR